MPIAGRALLQGGISQLYAGPGVPQEPQEAGPLWEKWGVSLERGGLRAGGRQERLGQEVPLTGAVAETNAQLKARVCSSSLPSPQTSPTASFLISTVFHTAWGVWALLVLWVPAGAKPGLCTGVSFQSSQPMGWPLLLPGAG